MIKIKNILKSFISLFKRKPKRIYIDLDDTMCHFRKRWKEIKASETIDYPQSKEGFFLELEPIENAIKTFHWLNQRFEVWILTAPSVMNPLCYTEKRLWVEKHLGLKICHRLIICPDKSLLKGDYLIDDTSSRGQLDFEGKFLQFGTEGFENWDKIKEFFRVYLMRSRISNFLKQFFS